jgi:hypothetical protein
LVTFTAAVFLDIEKSFDTTWHLGLLYKLSKLKFSISLIKLISSFLSERKFRVSVEGKVSTARDIQAGVPQGSVLFPAYDTPQTADVYLGCFDREQVKPSKFIHATTHLICIWEVPFRIFPGHRMS